VPRGPCVGVYELNAIAACVIGGASLFGAKGGAFGAAAGGLIVGTLNTTAATSRRSTPYTCSSSSAR
jgi:ribose/xylose/arabinose/galactoside ABC-type transport system permease subunit